MSCTTGSKRFDYCFVVIPGAERGKRVGKVKFGENGYYLTGLDIPSDTESEMESYVASVNEQFGIDKDLAESMLVGSMFGWDVPAAELARKHFDVGPDTERNERDEMFGNDSYWASLVK